MTIVKVAAVSDTTVASRHSTAPKKASYQRVDQPGGGNAR
jgi:hypothetical protein